jgi:hypothetical protein
MSLAEVFRLADCVMISVSAMTLSFKHQSAIFAAGVGAISRVGLARTAKVLVLVIFNVELSGPGTLSYNLHLRISGVRWSDWFYA